MIAEFAEIATDENRREDMKEATNIFRVLIKTLLNAGIITDRTRAFYGMYVDMDELKAEGDRMVGDDIAEEGIVYLQAINFRDRAAGAAARRRGVRLSSHFCRDVILSASPRACRRLDARPDRGENQRRMRTMQPKLGLIARPLAAA